MKCLQSIRSRNLVSSYLTILFEDSGDVFQLLGSERLEAAEAVAFLHQLDGVLSTS